MTVIVNIDVPDIAAAIAFYGAALGLKPGRLIADDVAELTGASSPIYLLENPAGSRPVPGSALARDYARHWTPVHLDFVVPDVALAARRALAAGAVQESERVDWKGSQCISFSDPFGHGFCLIAFDAGDTYALDDGP